MENNQKDKISSLESQLDRISELITRADTKAAILLALLGVVIGTGISRENLNLLNSMFIFLKDNFTPWIKSLLSIIIVLPYCFLLAGFVFLVLSLFARISTTTKGIPASALFFQKIAEHEKLSDFKKSFSKTLNDLESELITEIYINSKICSDKYRNFNIGLILIAVGSTLMIILQILLATLIS